MRAPYRIRLKTSCPERSVPIKNGPPGGASTAPTFVFGSKGARKGQKIATMMSRSTIEMPIQTTIPAAVRDCRRKEPTSRPTTEVLPRATQRDMGPLVANPRIHERIYDVDGQADDDHENSIIDNGALNRGVIAIANRQVHEATHPLKRKDSLRENRAAEEQGERQAHRGDYWHERVPKGMPKEHIPFGNSAGRRGLNEVRAHTFNNFTRRNPSKKARTHETEVERWQMVGNFLDDRLSGHNGSPHVPSEDVVDVPKVLDVKRVVQAKLPLDLVDELRVAMLPIERGNGVAGCHSQDKKGKGYQEKQHWDHQQGPSNDVGTERTGRACHLPSSLSSNRKEREGFRFLPHDTLSVKKRKNWIGSRVIPETLGLNTTCCGNWNIGK